MSLISAVAALVLAFISRTMGIEPTSFCEMVRAAQSHFSILALDYYPLRLNLNEDFMDLGIGNSKKWKAVESADVEVSVLW